jgi:hypothetical protein
MSVTICTAKIPITTAIKLKEIDFIATIIGIARIGYLNKMEAKLIKPAFERDFPKVIGMDFPRRKKLIILKHVPNKSPLAIAFSLTSIKRIDIIMVNVKAQ